MRRLLGALAAGAVLAATGCTGGEEPAADPDRVVLEPAEDGASHTHAPGQGHAEGGPIGDGRTPRAGGYRLAAVRLPSAADGPGEMSFRVLDRAGAPLTDYVEEQTKLLHLYVVRADLTAFRHVHPTLDADGTWRATVDLGRPGDWRVVAEFTPQGGERPVLLGSTVAVPDDGRSGPAAEPDPEGGEDAEAGDGGDGGDGVVRVRVDGGARTGDDGRLRLLVSSPDGRPLALGSYLGTSAHLTGFAVASGRVVHVHPYGAPEQTEDGTELTFHTTFTEAGDYRMFLQVRVEGLLHQVPVTVTVE